MKENKTQASPGSQTQAGVQEQLQRCKMAQILLASWLGLRSTQCFCSKERGTNSGTVLLAEGDHRGFHPAAVRSHRGLYLQRAQAAKCSCVAS